MAHSFLPEIWESIIEKTLQKSSSSKDSLMSDYGLKLVDILSIIKDLRENDLIIALKDGSGNIIYKGILDLSPKQIAAANYLGIGMKQIKKYCSLNLNKEKEVLKFATSFHENKMKEKKKNLEKINQEKIKNKIADLQKTNADLFDLISFSDIIINKKDENASNKSLAKDIKKELQNLVYLLAKEHK